MNHIVRRTPQQSGIQQNIEQLPARSHRNEAIVVASQRSLGVEPRLALGWRVEPGYWNAGFSLLVFQSNTGLCPKKYPTDLNEHGRLIIETGEDGTFDQVPEEGTHYFTFVLHRKVFFGLTEEMSVLRFSEIIPSTKVALGRIRDKIELQSMGQRHEVEAIEHEAKVDEAKVRRIRARRKLEEAESPPPPPQAKARSRTEGILGEESEDIDAMVEAVIAREQKISELKKDSRFRKLKPHQREEILERIAERFDPGEISARREMRDT